MLAAIPNTLFVEWLAYNNLDPIGEERHDFQAALVASVMAEIHRDTKRRAKPFQPGDFMPEWGQREEPGPAWQGMLKMVEMMNTMMGGQDLRPKRDDLSGI